MTAPFSPDRRRRFYLVLIPVLALSAFDFWDYVGTGMVPGHDLLLSTLGMPPLRGLAMAAQLVVHFLPLYALLSWMRGSGLRDGPDLWEYVLAVFILGHGFTLLVLGLVFLLSKLVAHPSWVNDYPLGVPVAAAACSTVAAGFLYSRVLTMRVMTG